MNSNDIAYLIFILMIMCGLMSLGCVSSKSTYKSITDSRLLKGYELGDCNVGFDDVPIHSVILNSEEEGEFVIYYGGSSGSYEQKTYYYFFLKEDVGWKLTKWDTENLIIVEDSETTPSLRRVVLNDSRKERNQYYDSAKAIVKNDTVRNVNYSTALDRYYHSGEASIASEEFCYLHNQLRVPGTNYTWKLRGRWGEYHDIYYLVVPEGTIIEEYDIKLSRDISTNEVDTQ